MQEKAISFAIFLAICLVFVFLFLFVKFLIWLFEKFLNWLCTPADEPQTELTISSTNNRGLNYAPSAPLSDRHIIVQLPPEIEDSNPPAYTNFSPPSYEEAFEMFKKSYLDSGQNARKLDQIGLNELVPSKVVTC